MFLTLWVRLWLYGSQWSFLLESIIIYTTAGIKESCGGRKTSTHASLYCNFVSMVELLVRHIVSLRLTFDQRLMKILPGVKEIWSGHEIKGSDSWPSTVTLTLRPHDWVMGSTHCLTKVNVWPKFTENPSRGYRRYEADTKLKAKARNLQLWPWPLVGRVVLWVLHIVLLRQIFDFKRKGNMEQTQNWILKLVTFSRDLDLDMVE